jgi:hypothetical protein
VIREVGASPGAVHGRSKGIEQAADAFAFLGSVGPGVFSYRDRDLVNDQKYTYRMTTSSTFGNESDPTPSVTDKVVWPPIYPPVNLAGSVIYHCGPVVRKRAGRWEMVAALESYIGCAQHIPVYEELARRNRDNTVYQFTWPRWNLGNHAIFVNNKIVENPVPPAPQVFTLNGDTGTLTFTSARHVTDKVYASYNFRMFSTIDELRFLSDALNQINLETPGTNWVPVTALIFSAPSLSSRRNRP